MSEHGADREADREDDSDHNHRKRVDRDESRPWEREPRRRRPPPRDETSDIDDDPTMRLILPVGQSGWAIASGYLGLFSVLCLPSPLALITGILAIREIRRNPKKHGMGRAIFGIIMGSIGTVLLGLLVVGIIMESLSKR